MEISVKKKEIKKMTIKEGLQVLNVILKSETKTKSTTKHDRELDYIIVRGSQPEEINIKKVNHSK